MVRRGLLATAALAAVAALPAHGKCADVVPGPGEASGAMRSITATDLIELRDIGPIEGSSNTGPPALALSPDGSELAFVIARADVATNGYCRALVVVPTRGGAPRVIDRGGEFIMVVDVVRGLFAPTGGAENVTPIWSPDGKSVGYRKRVDGITQVWRARADGGGAEPLTRSTTDVDRWAWLTDERIVFVTRPAPALRILVYLTGDAAVPEQRLAVGGMMLPIVFRTGAKATRDRVIWAMTWHQGAIRAALPTPPAMGLDPRTGELVVIVPTATAAAKGEAAIRARLEAIAGVPVRLRVLDQVDVNLSVEGGSRVEGVSPADGKRYLCTTGFTVTDRTRYGIATAAHCLDDLSYIDPQRVASPLSYVGQWGWGYQDVQINASPTTLAGRFYADTSRTIERPVTGQRTRDSTRAGDFVCHRGETTGYSCALVELTDFAPAGDLCGGACLPTWVTVAGPTCKGGDSGSPVFIGTTALGILKGATYRGGKCVFYFYMSVDYLPKGWSLVTANVPTPVAPVLIGARGAP